MTPRRKPKRETAAKTSESLLLKSLEPADTPGILVGGGENRERHKNQHRTEEGGKEPKRGRIY